MVSNFSASRAFDAASEVESLRRAFDLEGAQKKVPELIAAVDEFVEALKAIKE